MGCKHRWVLTHVLPQTFIGLLRTFKHYYVCEECGRTRTKLFWGTEEEQPPPNSKPRDN